MGLIRRFPSRRSPVLVTLASGISWPGYTERAILSIGRGALAFVGSLANQPAHNVTGAALFTRGELFDQLALGRRDAQRENFGSHSMLLAVYAVGHLCSV